MGLRKATLQKLTSVTNGQTSGAAIDVQFNPTSLRLTTNNPSESGQAHGHRQRQHLAQGPTKLSMQLVFDTADDANGEGLPVSVLARTKLVTQFLEPQSGQGNRQVPWALRFQWGDFIFEGILDSATEDVDLFAPNGTPLRAKVDVQITGQRRQELALETGPGATPFTNAPIPGEAMSGAPGTAGGAPDDRTETAQDGESAAGFAARLGLNPAAWRSFADQIDDPLSLPAGLPINVGAVAGASGVGTSTGVTAADPVAPEAALGAARGSAASGTTAASSDDRRAGFALAALGGIAQALDVSRVTRASGAAADTRRAFDAPRSAAAPGHVPSYGFGVPLRPRIAPATDARDAVVVGTRVPAARAAEAGPPTTDDPTVPPWTSLPQRDEGRARAEGVMTRRVPRKPCGCGGRCGGH